MADLTEKPRSESGFGWGEIQESSLSRDRVSPVPPLGLPRGRLDPRSGLSQPERHLPTAPEMPASRVQMGGQGTPSPVTRPSLSPHLLGPSSRVLTEPRENLGPNGSEGDSRRPLDQRLSFCPQLELGLSLRELEQHGHYVVGRGKGVSGRRAQFAKFPIQLSSPRTHVACRTVGFGPACAGQRKRTLATTQSLMWCWGRVGAL